MKNIFKLFVFTLVIIFGCIKYTYALENDTKVEIDWISGVYANRKVGSQYIWNQLGYIKANGKISYCLEPNEFITENIYDSTVDFNIKGISASDKEYIELLAYYGYGYSNHTSKEYYMASQELIWEYVSNYDIFWTDGPKKTGNVLNIDSYKNDILQLVKGHYVKPSFDGGLYTIKHGDAIYLTDNNKVLENYEIVDFDLNARIVKNRLKLSAYELKSNEVLLRKKKINNDVSIIYTKNDSQTVASFGLTNDVVASVKYEVTPLDVTVRIYKKNLDTTSIIMNREFSFKIRDVSTWKFINNGEVFKTNKDGYFEIEHLSAGNYQIEEIKTDKDYYLNEENVRFVIDSKTGNYLEVDFYNKPFTSKIIFTKIGDVLVNFDKDFIYESKPITGAVYQVFAKNDIVIDGVNYYKKGELVQEITIDKEKVETKTLPNGEYYIVEKSAPEGYQKDSKCYDVSLNDNQEYLKLYNDRYQGTLKITKTGNSKLLTGVEFGLYAYEDIKNYQGEVIVLKDSLIKKVTTIEGKIEINNLPNGKYYVKELQSLKGYKLDEKKYTFEINNKNKDIELLLNNELDNPKLPNTFEKREIVKNLIRIILISLIILNIIFINKYKREK